MASDTDRPPDLFAASRNATNCNGNFFSKNDSSAATSSGCDVEYGWLNDANNNASSLEVASASDTSYDLFVFNDLKDYINKLNYSAYVNLTSLEYDNYGNSSYGNVSCAVNGTYGNYSVECVPVDDTKVDAKNWWALILFVVPFFTIFGNVLVILAVKRERTLQNVTNYFIVSLAIADLLVATVVMPFAVYVLVSTIFSFSLDWSYRFSKS